MRFTTLLILTNVYFTCLAISIHLKYGSARLYLFQNGFINNHRKNTIESKINSNIDEDDGMMNSEFEELRTERKIKIPYFVEYPTDKVNSEPNMTKEEVVKSILAELGFFNQNKMNTNNTIHTTQFIPTLSDIDSNGNPLTDTNNYNNRLNLVNKSDSEGSSLEDSLEDITRDSVNHNVDNSVGSTGVVDEKKEYLVKKTIVDRMGNLKGEQESSILEEEESPALGRQRVRWFPNYVSRSLTQLHYYLKMADIILDVRDGRIPYIPPDDYLLNLFESEFPTKPRITVFTHSDKLPKIAMADWMRYYRTINRSIYQRYNMNIENEDEKRVLNRTMFIDARNGLKEIIYLRKHIFKMCSRVNKRRERKGMNPREIRVILMGMPNVGKSSIVNRLLNRRVARCYNSPGITRDINIYKETKEGTANYSVRNIKKKRLLLIDTPGIICNARHVNRNRSQWSKTIDEHDQRMLIYSGLNIIGECGYEVDEVAIVILREILKILFRNKNYVKHNLSNYILLKSLFNNEDGIGGTDEDLEFNVNLYLERLTKWFFGNNLYSCCSKLLNDFRNGKLGKIILQIPPTNTQDYLQVLTNKSRLVNNPLKTDSYKILEYKRGLYEGW